MRGLLLLIACTTAMIAVQAQEKKDVIVPRTNEVSRIRLANQLAKYGYETYSAVSLIEAAKMLLKTETQPIQYVSYVAGVGENGNKSGVKPEFSVQNLISDAKKFADGNTNILALLASVESSAKDEHRGRLGGPGRIVSNVSANSTDTYVIAFKAGLSAEIFVSGDGDTDLDLYVYDENGRLIESDTDYSDDCYVRWIPAWTGNYVVKIFNPGRVYNKYIMVTN